MTEFNPPFHQRSDEELIEIANCKTDDWQSEAIIQANIELEKRNIKKEDQIEYLQYVQSEKDKAYNNRQYEDYSFFQKILILLFKWPFLLLSNPQFKKKGYLLKAKRRKQLIIVGFEIYLLIAAMVVYNKFTDEKSAPPTEIGQQIKLDSLGGIPLTEKVIDTVYVIDRNGIEIKQLPNENSEYITKAEYGERLEVVEDLGDWYGVEQRIHRIFEKKEGNFEVWRDEKVYVEKNKTGKFTNIHLIEKDFYQLSSMTIDGKTTFYDELKFLDGVLKFELIDKKTFDQMSKTAIDFFTCDSNLYPKENGIIELNCKTKVVKFKDKGVESESDMMEEYLYLGQFEKTEKYLILGTYYESYDYKLVDKNTGTTLDLIDFPLFSPDLKQFVCIGFDYFDICSAFVMYSLNANEIKQIHSFSFKNWIPESVENKGIFWANDGYLYIKVQHIKTAWKENGSFNSNYQYVRVKIF